MCLVCVVLCRIVVCCVGVNYCVSLSCVLWNDFDLCCAGLQCFCLFVFFVCIVVCCDVSWYVIVSVLSHVCVVCAVLLCVVCCVVLFVCVLCVCGGSCFVCVCVFARCVMCWCVALVRVVVF